MDDRFKKYTEHTYSGRQLLEAHNLSETGKWKILGEDPNCDLGGIHVMPTLAVYFGTLEEAVKYAIDLPNFWTWGGGGKLIKQNTKFDVTEDVAKFITTGIRERALAKLTAEEKQALGLE